MHSENLGKKYGALLWTFLVLIALSSISVAKANEVASTFKPNCVHATFIPHFVVNNSATLARIRNTDCFFGDIHIRDVEHVQLPNLKMLYGSLIVKHSLATSIEAPLLLEVNGSLVLSDNKNLMSISFPKLGSLNGTHRIHSNPQVTELTLPSLGAVNGILVISDNHAMTTLDFRALGGINGYVGVLRNSNLDHVNLRSLSAINGRIELK